MSLLGGYLFTQHRKTLLVENAKYFVKVFSAIHVCGHGLAALPMGRTHLYFQQEQSFFVRACPLLRHFPFNQFIFLFEKKQKILITIYFLNLRGSFDTVQNTVNFGGNERCRISTARSKNESAFQRSLMLSYTKPMML